MHQQNHLMPKSKHLEHNIEAFEISIFSFLGSLIYLPSPQKFDLIPIAIIFKLCDSLYQIHWHRQQTYNKTVIDSII